MRTKFWAVPDDLDKDYVRLYDADGKNPPYGVALIHIDFFYPNTWKGGSEIYDLLSTGRKLELEVDFKLIKELED